MPRIRRRLWLSLTSLLLVIVMGLPSASAVGLSQEQLQRLQRREVVLLDLLPPGGGARGVQGGTGIIAVNAAPDAVWRILVDYPRHRGLYPKVVEAEILDWEPEHALVRYVIGVGPFSFVFHMDNYPDPARRRLAFRLAQQQENDLFRENWGYWRVESYGDGSLLTYAMASRTVLPAFLTRGAERDGLREALKAVRDRAERG